MLLDICIFIFCGRRQHQLPKRPTQYFSQCQLFNPLTPVPPVTAHDKPWPFFLFWRHHLRPKLASSTLNFCRRETSFQWYPDQNDRPNGALDMHRNAQKVEWKTQSKFRATTLGCSILKFARPNDTFSEVFQLQGSPVGGQSLWQKEEKWRERKGEKKFQKSKSLKT